MEVYDLVVIGSGPAGEKAAVKAAYFNYKVAIIEKNECFGGAGIQTGTVPSKTLKETSLHLSGIYSKGIFSIDRELGRIAGIQDFMYRKNLVVHDLYKYASYDGLGSIKGKQVKKAGENLSFHRH